MEPHKYCFFGTPEVASKTLAALLSAGRVPALVVTNPDAPKGRGHVLTPSPTRAAAEAAGIPVFTPETLDADAIEKIRNADCAYAVVVAYGKILPDDLLAAFPKGVLNVHYSLLPKYRGATPMEAALLHGDATTGVSIQKMAKELDAGDILAQEETPIAPEETARELRPRLITLGAELLLKTLPAFEQGALTPAPQDSAQATRARKFKKEDGELDLAAPAGENWNKYRAYADTIGTYFYANGMRVKITKAALKDGAFVIERVIPEGKREMAYADFAR